MTCRERSSVVVPGSCEIGNVPEDDWRRTLNLGIGMVFVIGQKDAPRAERLLRKLGEECYTVGRVITAKRGGPRVEYR